MRKDALLVAMLAAAVAGCGDAAAPTPLPPVAASAPSAEAAPKPRTRTETAAPVDVDALVARLLDDSADQDGAMDALVAVGAPALDRLLAELHGDGYDSPVRQTILRFGASAVGPLVKLLDDKDQTTREHAIALLSEMAPDWAYGEQGPAVCRALLARLRAEDNWSAQALTASRPAGAVVAKDLAEMWRAGDADRRRTITSILESLGPDAAAAIPIVRAVLVAEKSADAGMPPEEAAWRRVEALRLLAAIDAGDVSLIDPIETILVDGTSEERRMALDFLRGLGDAAAPATPKIVALLKSEDSDVRERAWKLLAALPSLDDATWREFISTGGEELAELTKEPAFAARVARTLPELTPDGLMNAHHALLEGGSFDMTSLSTMLLRSAAPEARVLALHPWEGDKDDAPPLPKEMLELLADADPHVRAHVAIVFAELKAVSDERLRDIAMSLRASPEASVRVEALSVLGTLALRDPKLVDAVSSAFSDPDATVRSAAIHALPSSADDEPKVRAALLNSLADKDAYVASSALGRLAALDAPNAEERAAIVAALVKSLLADADSFSTDWQPRADELLRFDGGAAALARAIEPALAPDVVADLWRHSYALNLSVFLAPHDASIRPTLQHLREIADRASKSYLDEAIAKIDFASATDPVAIARGAGDDRAKVQRLLALREPGLRAILVLASVTNDRERLLPLLKDVPLKASIVAAANETGTDDDAKARRKGAAILAPSLPDAEAVAVLTKLVSDIDARREVAAALRRIETRSPGFVPPALVARLLRDADGKRDWTGLSLVELLGPRAADLDAELVPDLRKIRDDAASHDRARAAVALWRITRREDEALPALRAVLGHPERIPEGMPWNAVGDALKEMRLGPDDIAAIVATIQRAATLYAPREMDQEGPRSDDAVVGSFAALIPVLERTGLDATPAIPALRVVLSRSAPYADSPGAAAAHALASFGAAARAAIPDLRRWESCPDAEVSRTARDAIRQIESAPR